MNSRLRAFVFVLILMLSLTSCSLFDTGDRFVGGDFLDDEMMSAIREEIFGSEVENAESTNTENTDDSNMSLESETESLESEKINETNTEKVVYWTKSGKVWHTSKDCGSLKNSKEILSGSVEVAKAEGKEKLCSYCASRDEH